MKPSQLSANLRIVANKIDASDNPSRRLVVNSLRRLLAAVAPIQAPIDWARIERALVLAFSNRQIKYTPGEVYTLDEIKPFDSLNANFGIMFSVVCSDNEVGISVSFEGDADYAWIGSSEEFKNQFDARLEAAKKAVQLAKDMWSM